MQCLSQLKEKEGLIGDGRLSIAMNFALDSAMLGLLGWAFCRTGGGCKVEDLWLVP